MRRKQRSADRSRARLCLLACALAGTGSFACAPAAEQARPAAVPQAARKAARAAGCRQARDLPARQLEEVRLIGKLVAKEPAGPNRQALLQRLALRNLDLADAARARLQALEDCRAAGDARLDPAIAAARRSHTRFLTRAAKVYGQLLDQLPPPAAADEHLYVLATILFELKQDKQALGRMAQLAKDYPRSAYVADAYLAFGEQFFVRAQMTRALAFYDKVRGLDGSHLRPYATYKAAWCHLNLDEPARALALFAEVIRTAGASDDRGRALAREALLDFVRTYARAGDPARAVETLSALAPPADLDKALDRLEATWRDLGRTDLAAALRARRGLPPAPRETRP